MATPDESIAEVKRLLELAREKIAATPESTLSTVTFGLFGADDEAPERKNLASDEERFTTWSTTYRRWATNGQRDDGTAYDWSRWFDFGHVLASDINAQAQDAVDADAFIADAEAVAATVHDVEQKASAAAQGIGGLLLNKWVWIAAGGGALLVGVAYVRSLLPKRANA